MGIFRALKQLRAIDDKIIYALNVSTPTASMQVEHDRNLEETQRAFFNYFVVKWEEGALVHK